MTEGRWASASQQSLVADSEQLRLGNGLLAVRMCVGCIPRIIIRIYINIKLVRQLHPEVKDDSTVHSIPVAETKHQTPEFLSFVPPGEHHYHNINSTSSSQFVRIGIEGIWSSNQAICRVRLWQPHLKRITALGFWTLKEKTATFSLWLLRMSRTSVVTLFRIGFPAQCNPKRNLYSLSPILLKVCPQTNPLAFDLWYTESQSGHQCVSEIDSKGRLDIWYTCKRCTHHYCFGLEYRNARIRKLIHNIHFLRRSISNWPNKFRYELTNSLSP